MPHSGPINVLFICNDNAARSLMAEVLLNELGHDRFIGYSAGNAPLAGGQPDPGAIAAMDDAGLPTDGLRSKSWDEYGTPNSPHMDLVVTLCDEAAGETCPTWPGQPATAHWSYADPRTEASRKDPAAFMHTLQAIRRHIDLLVNLPDERIERLVIEDEVRQLGQRLGAR